MNWKKLRLVPWLDTRAAFAARLPRGAALLDLGSSDGETLRHIAELRPDLRLFSVDLEGKPECYPAHCQFQRADLQRDRLPWADGSMDAITCMHLVEHLTDLEVMIAEMARLVRPGGTVYIETPHPKTVNLPSLRAKGIGDFTLNFFDDLTHVKPVPVGDLAAKLEPAFEIERTGTSRNLLFAASHLVYKFRPPSRQKYTAKVHWIGWSAYLIAHRRQARP
jgi:SAM-dependent methyltransferase